jgi:hypothetical protein
MLRNLAFFERQYYDLKAINHKGVRMNWAPLQKVTGRLPRLSQGFRTVALSFAGIVGSLLIAVTAFTGTASAFTSCDNPSRAICFYTHSNWSGTSVSYGSLTTGVCYNLQVVMNDVISSWDNNIPAEVVMYEHANCSGATAIAQAQDEDYFFSWTYMNDRVSSFKMPQ